MKKNIIAITLILITNITNAQFAVFGGLNKSNLKYSQDFNINPKTKQGFNAGIQVYSPVFLNKYSIMSEIGFSQMGSKSDYVDSYYSSNSTLSLDYINLSILGKYSVIGSGFVSVFAGPQIGYLLKAKNKYEYVDYYIGDTQSGEEDAKDYFKKTDISMIFGAEIAIPVGYPVYASAKYQLGLTDINNQNNSDGISSKNNNISFGISYRFE